MNLSLHSEKTLEKSDTAPANAPIKLVVTLDHRAWLQLLVDEWWPLQEGVKGICLGVNSSVSYVNTDDRRIAVSAWIDHRLLPRSIIPILRNGTWAENTLDSLSAEDLQIYWPGPIPLFAITTFSVSSHDERDRLLAMCKGFANVELPRQPILITVTEGEGWGLQEPSATMSFLPPARWNRIRGAAAMAIWAVPKIAPWLDMLCYSLSPTSTEIGSDAAVLEADWLMYPVWCDSAENMQQSPMWRAIIETFETVHLQKEWRPITVLSQIAATAEKYGVPLNSLDDLTRRTRDILNDRASIDISLATADPLGFSLQLVLLRPRATAYKSWAIEFPGMPPAAWWTGAILSGFLEGYRDLLPQFRGSPESRRVLALRTWGLKMNGSPWSDDVTLNLCWRICDGMIQFLEGDQVWATRKCNNRGNWYIANYDDTEVQAEALAIAKILYKDGVQKTLLLNNQTLQISGDGSLTIDTTNSSLTANGKIHLHLNADSKIFDALHVEKFRAWIAKGSIAKLLPAPPSVRVVEEAMPQPAMSLSGLVSVPVANGPQGLVAISEFLSKEEEKELIIAVDSVQWLDELSRRVQHYGWKYDYKARKITQSAFIGALPDWAAKIGQRLLEAGLVDELPDQVIVNEYIGNQGISKHIDCASCFRGPVVTISLCESWGMTFRGPDSAKFECILDRRSAVSISGPARSVWSHEIPKRKKEAFGLRGRRVSLTFRKVDLTSS
ncbi:alpha-ketoglutarate-dependent dioxygenase AlkB [Janthinobacterium agaricidamnosum]|nr:alpha-ketoglutarate-dependent dioxygenase AlkB [Janthinobacterium agaricidamnosum]